MLILRAQLNAKGTHSAKRKLKKLAGRERDGLLPVRYTADAKEIASMPFRTFVLEDLTGIRFEIISKREIPS